MPQHHRSGSWFIIREIINLARRRHTILVIIVLKHGRYHRPCNIIHVYAIRLDLLLLLFDILCSLIDDTASQNGMQRRTPPPINTSTSKYPQRSTNFLARHLPHPLPRNSVPIVCLGTGHAQQTAALLHHAPNGLGTVHRCGAHVSHPARWIGWRNPKFFLHLIEQRNIVVFVRFPPWLREGLRGYGVDHVGGASEGRFQRYRIERKDVDSIGLTAIVEFGHAVVHRAGDGFERVFGAVFLFECGTVLSYGCSYRTET
mmetsp:Transcript_35193/g.51694  ORF Transcript_35193/g.51694 Transcript_35193/m.51694 type:complete len:258 (+) Transcript_35193:494-1267(+)